MTRLADPAYQAGTFYDKLFTVPGWAAMPLTPSAQLVQRSAYPDAHLKWTDDALNLVDTLSNTIADCAIKALDALPAGFTLPANTPPAVTTAAVRALGQLGTPYSFGGHCTDPHPGDPSKQCDCSCLVILSPHTGQRRDLQERVEDTVVNAAPVDMGKPRTVGGIVAKLQSLPPAAVPTRVCDREAPR